MYMGVKMSMIVFNHAHFIVLKAGLYGETSEHNYSN